MAQWFRLSCLEIIVGFLIEIKLSLRNSNGACGSSILFSLNNNPLKIYNLLVNQEYNEISYRIFNFLYSKLSKFSTNNSNFFKIINK